MLTKCQQSANSDRMKTKSATARTSKKQKDETGNWPFIRWIESRGRWMVDTRTATGGKRTFYKNKEEATGAAQAARVRRTNEGNAGFDDVRLSRYGWTVARAIEFTIEHLQRQEASSTVTKAVEALLVTKKGKVGDIRYQDIQNRLAKVTAHFSDRVISGITEAELAGFLDTIPHPATRNDYRKEIVMLWLFASAKSRKWAERLDTKNELEKSPEPAKARIILTVEQVASLMAASEDEDVLALNSLILFGGCRREEVEKMDWKHIDFASDHINVTAEISKVSAERFAPLPANLRAWLKPIAKKSGMIVDPANFTRRLRATWKRAGIQPWPQDAHRHSFISYRRQLVGDATTALEAGTSEKIIKKHYKRPVTTTQATAFFSIAPIEAGKITSISEAAA